MIARTVVWAVWAMVAGGCANLGAQSRDWFVTRSINGRSPLSVRAEMLPMADPSYTQFHIAVSDGKGPSPADRSLTIGLFVGSSESSDFGIAYYRPLLLPQGARDAECYITLLSSGNSFCWDVAVFEDGIDIEDTRDRRVSSSSRDFQYSWQREQGVPAVCLVGDQDDRGRMEQDALALFDPETVSSPYVVGSGVNARPTKLPPQAMLDAATVAADWRIFAPNPYVVVTAQTLQDVMQSNPPLSRSLRLYAASGGCLYVAGEDPARLNEVVADFLSLPLAAESRESGNVPAESPWNNWTRRVGDRQWMVIPFGRGRVVAGNHLEQIGGLGTGDASVKQEASGT
ncbi:MAG: hypothetical protein D6753_05640, partial [Planctomycetota bacterium]